MAVSTYTSDWRSRSKAQLLDDVQVLITMRDRETARRQRAEALLREAIEELTECRSFIAVETRHYPTVDAINEKIERLRHHLPRCVDCGPGYRLGDEGCGHLSTPDMPSVDESEGSA